MILPFDFLLRDFPQRVEARTAQRSSARHAETSIATMRRPQNPQIPNRRALAPAVEAQNQAVVSRQRSAFSAS